MAEELVPEPVNCLLVQTGSAGRANQVDRRLRDGSPAIYAHLRGDTLVVDVEVLSDDQADFVGTRLAQELTTSDPTADLLASTPPAADGSVRQANADHE